MPRHRATRSKLRSLYVWHRYVGLSAAAFVLLLAVTGVLLNHTQGLRLHERHVQAAWLLDWYGIRPPEEVVAFRAGRHWISQWGERLFFDAEPVQAPALPLIGAAELGGMLALAMRGRILLLTPDGRPVEILGDAEGVPSGLRRVGQAAGQLVVEAAHGRYMADADLLRWRSGAPADVSWSDAEPLPPELRGELSRRYRGAGLPLERVLLDLHSGRFLGAWGVWLMDAAAVLMGFLAASGGWLWLRQVLRRRARS